MRTAPFILTWAITLATVIPAAGADLPNFYRSVEIGFSIRYPNGMKPVLRDPNEFGATEMGWKFVLDFNTTGENPDTVLRLIKTEPKLPTYPTLDLATIRTGCKSYEMTTVGQRPALICVTCGRASCSWTIHVQGVPGFSIVSFDQGARETSAPVGGDLPIRSMIDSIQFEAPEPR